MRNAIWLGLVVVAWAGSAAADDALGDAMMGGGTMGGDAMMGSGKFDSGNLVQNATYAWKANTTGTFFYHCTYHPEMVGNVTVMAGDALGATNVAIQGFKFVPENVTVPLGTNVTWVNRDAAAHTATHLPQGMMAHDDAMAGNGTMSKNDTMMHDNRTGDGMMSKPTPGLGAAAFVAAVAALALAARRAR